jgi:uncharacterized protein (TIGR02996 family)
MARKKPAPSMRETFELALTANPDDLSASMAYADWLSEQGDPRGEFIQVQLALENAAAKRDELLQREAALLQQHQKAWLGELAEPFLERDDITFRFRRGWLDEVQIGQMREDLAGLLAAAPEIRLLRRLAVLDPNQPPLDLGEAYGAHVLVGTAWFEEDEEVALVPLLESPYLSNIRIFQLGDAEHERCDVGDGPIAGLIEKMPRLEVLHLFVWKLDEIERIFSMSLPRLRSLRVGGVFNYPVEALAQNASLAAVEEILLQPASPDGHYKLYPQDCSALVSSPHLEALVHLRMPFLWAGDNACQGIVESGALSRLKTLGLPYSAITDAGAGLLAGSDLSHLEALDLVGNHMTEEGIARLRAKGVNLLWEPQTSPEEENADEDEDGEDLVEWE